MAHQKDLFINLCERKDQLEILEISDSALSTPPRPIRYFDQPASPESPWSNSMFSVTDIWEGPRMHIDCESNSSDMKIDEELSSDKLPYEMPTIDLTKQVNGAVEETPFVNNAYNNNGDHNMEFQSSAVHDVDDKMGKNRIYLNDEFFNKYLNTYELSSKEVHLKLNNEMNHDTTLDSASHDEPHNISPKQTTYDELLNLDHSRNKPTSDIQIVPDSTVDNKKNNEDQRMLAVKEEVCKDEDILLFTDEMDAFNNNNANFEIGNMGETVNLNDPATFQINFSDDQMSQLLVSDNFAKISESLNASYKTDGTKNDNIPSHMVKYKHQDGKHTKVWQCGVCQKEFGHQYILMRHLPTHTDERKFRCNTCGKAFRQMSTLSQHRAIHSAERPYVCEICQKTFNRVSTLISHRKTHTGLKPHRCHLCNKAFHQKGNLRNHIFTHTNERPYKCDICSKGFNQMSNLMCHKLKAHQRSDKPRYTCQSCGKDFQKRMALRNHEQYEHGDVVAGAANGVPGVRYTNGVLVDPIKTAAMELALATDQVPFALLRPLNGIPVLVRVLTAGQKQMLVPATAEDLKKHGQITITPKMEESKDGKEGEDKEGQYIHVGETHENGSTVQIKIPVVATVIQRCDKNGGMCMDVESPGPDSDGAQTENYMYATTTNLTKALEINAQGVNQECIAENSQINGEGKPDENGENKIEYFDLTTIDDEKNQFFREHFNYNNENTMKYENNIINLSETRNEENNTIHLYSQSGEMFNFSSEPNAKIFQILEKSQPINISEKETILNANSLVDDSFTIL